MKRKYLNKKKVVRKGFTLVEVVIMMAIVAISFIGINKIYVQIAKDSSNRNNDAVAGALGQEFVEVIRAIRDYNFECKSDKNTTPCSEDRSWYEGLDLGCSRYVINNVSPAANNPPTLTCASANNRGLCKDASGSGYVSCPAAGALFTRSASITIPQVDAESGEVGEIQVEVEVSWKDANNDTRTKTTSDILYHWQNYKAKSETQNVLSDQADFNQFGGRDVQLKYAYNLQRDQSADSVIYGAGDDEDERGRATFKWLYDDSDSASRQADWRIVMYDPGDTADNSIVIAKPISQSERKATQVYVPLCNDDGNANDKAPAELRNALGCNGNEKISDWDNVQRVKFRLVLWDDSGNMSVVPDIEKDENNDGVPDDGEYLELRTAKKINLQVVGGYSASPVENHCIRQGSNVTFKWSIGDSLKQQSFYRIKVLKGASNYMELKAGEENNPKRDLSVARVFQATTPGAMNSPGAYSWTVESHDINYGNNWDGKEQGKTWDISSAQSFRINRQIDVSSCSNALKSVSNAPCNEKVYKPSLCYDTPCPGTSCGSDLGGCDAGYQCNPYKCKEEWHCKKSNGTWKWCGCGKGKCATNVCDKTRSCDDGTCFKNTCYKCYSYVCHTCYTCSQKIKFSISDDSYCNTTKYLSIPGVVSDYPVSCGGGSCTSTYDRGTWVKKDTSNCGFSSSLTVTDGTSSTNPEGGYTSDSCSY